MNQSVKIRKAVIGDESEIAHVHLNSWRETYESLLPRDFIDNLLFSFRRRMLLWRKLLANSTDPSIFVAEDECGIVGFSRFGPARDEFYKNEFYELEAIYLLKKYQKSGVGYSLLTSGFKEAYSKHNLPIYCWVLENNPAIKFYEKTGAIFSGREKHDSIGGVKVKEFAYVWTTDDIKKLIE